MALVLGNPNGEFRGKLGGQVYSRNGGGAIVRSYVKPVNPNTIAQLDARSKFSSSVAGFRTLTSAQRAQWNEFAHNHFSPKKKRYQNTYSGFQAWMSLNTASKNAVANTRTYDLFFDGVPKNSITDRSPFLLTGPTPPLRSVYPYIANSSGDLFQLRLVDGGVSSTGDVSITIACGNNLPGGISVDDNEDSPAGYRIGYAVYMSNGNPNDNMSYPRPMMYNVAYFEAWKPNGSWVGTESLEEMRLTSTDVLNTGAYQQFPLTGEYVTLTVYAMADFGLLARVGSIEVQLT